MTRRSGALRASSRRKAPTPMRHAAPGPWTTARKGVVITPRASCAPSMPSRPIMPTSRPGLPSVCATSDTKASTGK